MISPIEPGGGIDSSNRFEVVRSTADPGVLMILNLKPAVFGCYNRAEALNLAAWLVALADPGHMDFLRVLEAIEKS